MHGCRGVAHVGKAQLGIQPGVVVPGQPVCRVQLAIRQAHHLGEAGRGVIDLVDQTLRPDQWDTVAARDLQRAIIHICVTFSQALSFVQQVRGLLTAADRYIHTRAT